MEYTSDHSPDACIIPTRINVYNWRYSKFSLEKLHLSWLVSIFYKKNICPKETQRKQNQNKVNETKTVENIANWSSDVIYRDL